MRPPPCSFDAAALRPESGSGAHGARREPLRGAASDRATVPARVEGSETMNDRRGRLDPTLMRVNGSESSRAITDQAWALLTRSCLPGHWRLALCRDSPSSRAASRGRGGRRRVSDKSTGNMRVHLSRTSAIQRLQEAQGVDGIPFTVQASTRSVLDDKRRPGVRQEVRQLRPDSPKVLTSRQHGRAPHVVHSCSSPAKAMLAASSSSPSDLAQRVHPAAQSGSVCR